jgi:predicted Zn-dependent peptidase
VTADRSRLPDIGPDPVFRFPDVVRHVSPNGLPIRTVEQPGVPIITFVLQVEGGSGADPGDQEGLAAVTADMVDEGTGSLSALDVSDALARIGADYDVDVGPDVTTFSLTTLGRFARRGGSLLAGMVTSPSLRSVDFERVRQLRLDRLRQLKDLAPAAAERAFLRLLYDGHPYGHLPIGNERALRSLSIDAVEALHARAFRPTSATLIVGGAMAHEELLAVALECFGGWSASSSDPAEAGTGSRAPAADIEPTSRAATRLALVPRERAAQSELRIGHLSARRNTPDYHALLVMNAVLGGQFVSRINLKLREEKGYTYGARTGFDWRRGATPFALQASVHTGSTADAVRDALDELAAIRGPRPLTPGELTLAKASLTRGYARNFETVQQVTRSVAQLALYGLPDTYFAEFVPTVNGITAADVTRVAERYLDPSKLTTVIVGDHSAIAESLAGLGLGDAQILPLEL